MPICELIETNCIRAISYIECMEDCIPLTGFNYEAIIVIILAGLVIWFIAYDPFLWHKERRDQGGW
jgi:hypothetical protein